MNPNFCNPKVSIVVPIYGVERYIERCCVSLFSQTYNNLEYIFVDDKTKDSSIDVLKTVLEKYAIRKKQVVVIHHEVNKGLSSARETGIQAVTGDYIVHVDSDDFVETDFVEQCVKKVVEDDVDLVITGTWHEYEDKKVADYAACQNCDKDVYVGNVIAQNYPSNVWGKMYKTSLYREHDVHCIPGISYGEDYAVLPKLIFVAKRVGLVHQPLYHYVHYNSTSFTNVFKWKNLEDLMLVESNIHDFFAPKKMFLDEMKLSHLKWTAWTLRRIYETDSEEQRAFALIGRVDLKIKDLKKLSINHAILVLCYQLKLNFIAKMYVKISKNLVGRYIRKK